MAILLGPKSESSRMEAAALLRPVPCGLCAAQGLDPGLQAATLCIPAQSRPERPS